MLLNKQPLDKMTPVDFQIADTEGYEGYYNHKVMVQVSFIGIYVSG